MESLRSDLLTNEKECKKLQERIEWVSRRRAEIREEVKRCAQKLLTVKKMIEQPLLKVPNSKINLIKKILKITPPAKSISPKVSKDIPLIIIMSQDDTADNASSINYSYDSTKYKKKDKPEVLRKGGGNKVDQSR